MKVFSLPTTCFFISNSVSVKMLSYFNDINYPALYFERVKYYSTAALVTHKHFHKIFPADNVGIKVFIHNLMLYYPSYGQKSVGKASINFN